MFPHLALLIQAIYYNHTWIFLIHFSKTPQKEVHDNQASRSHNVPCRHDKATGCFWQLSEKTYKSTFLWNVNVVPQQFSNTAVLPHSYIGTSYFCLFTEQSMWRRLCIIVRFPCLFRLMLATKFTWGICDSLSSWLGTIQYRMNFKCSFHNFYN